MSRVWTDLVVGIRTIVRSPGYSAITLLTVALAVGANTLLFSIANPLVLRPLPIRDADRLGWILMSNPERGIDRSPASLPDLLDWRRMTSLAPLAAYDLRSGTLTGHGDARRIQTARATANLFEVWGLGAERGRLFQPGEDAVGQPASGILSYRYWQAAFQGDPAVIGRTYMLDGRQLTIVGVITREIEIGNLADAAERCRKVMLVTRMGIAFGALIIVAGVVGLIRLSPTVFVMGIAATVGGIALFGSTRSTREQLLTTIGERETLRATIIDGLDLRSAS